MTFLLYAGLVLISVLLTVQSAHVLFLMLYTWDQPGAERKAAAPETFLPPQLSFSVLLPARHEEDVIQTTIERVVRADYPDDLLEVFVICSADDTGTIGKAEEKIEELGREGLHNVEVIVFDDKPINKPHGLNAALPHASHDVVTIFDAEDDIHPAIFDLVNTVMIQDEVNVVQAGVQLMNYQSTWYSALNVLEYFFWFKSRLHYHAHWGSIPLGGNTVFFTRELLVRLGGWDEHNLTEDADLGLRVSAAGERVRVVYDDRYVTKEETPPTLGHFIRQRTRWSQGFMQTLRKGTWKQMPTRKQRWLAFYVLAFPHGQALLGVYLLFSLGMILLFKVPVLVALISYLPVLMLVAHFLTAVVGLYEFAEAHGLQATSSTVFRMALAWYPYQLVLCYAAMRAMRRQMQGRHDWEKTAHVGAHRAQAEGAESRVA
ncbi:glycosyltransferase [Streptomyces sp. KM273126]|uniref:glycosyltransferase n=1 Tax=Streptomyces sp. KM273126 TaxID=2545247 RepID=UPI00103D3117|nr:glycosyltransferase [Streptomyces sp. KM273126]MBA2809112.1 glycosyltransferase [Streptomyces sp. KM273126]